MAQDRIVLLLRFRFFFRIRILSATLSVIRPSVLPPWVCSRSLSILSWLDCPRLVPAWDLGWWGLPRCRVRFSEVPYLFPRIRSDSRSEPQNPLPDLLHPLSPSSHHPYFAGLIHVRSPTRNSDANSITARRNISRLAQIPGTAVRALSARALGITCGPRSTLRSRRWSSVLPFCRTVLLQHFQVGRLTPCLWALSFAQSTSSMAVAVTPFPVRWSPCPLDSPLGAGAIAIAVTFAVVSASAGTVPLPLPLSPPPPVVAVAGAGAIVLPVPLQLPRPLPPVLPPRRSDSSRRRYPLSCSLVSSFILCFPLRGSAPSPPRRCGGPPPRKLEPPAGLDGH